VGGLPTSTVNGFGVDPTNAKVMYVGMRDGVYRSEDGGGRWNQAKGAPRDVAAVATNPKRPGEVYAATTDGRLFVSRDGGRAWDAVR
jgi:photosystem II stability/assembly factor-like uncharacterized protein